MGDETFPPGCDHAYWELGGDEHRAECLGDAAAAARLAWRDRVSEPRT